MYPEAEQSDANFEHSVPNQRRSKTSGLEAQMEDLQRQLEYLNRHKTSDYGSHLSSDESSDSNESARFDMRDDDSDSVASLYEDALRVAEEQRKNAEAAQKVEGDRQAKIAAEAVEQYKASIVAELDEVQQDADEAKDRLSRVFDLTPDRERVDRYLEDLRAQKLSNKEAGKLLGQLGAVALAETTRMSPNPGSAVIQPKRSK